MLTREKKLDLNQLAKSIADQATGEVPKLLRAEQLTGRQAAGRKGGLSGGKSRMESLTAAQRKELSAKATQARRQKEALASQEASAKADYQLNKVN